MDEEKYLYAIIRKPQEGKTFVCLENIKMSKEHIHIVITMNTLTSNKQFLERSIEFFGKDICVFNSRKEESYKQHAKNVSQVV